MTDEEEIEEIGQWLDNQLLALGERGKAAEGTLLFERFWPDIFRWLGVHCIPSEIEDYHDDVLAGVGSYLQNKYYSESEAIRKSLELLLVELMQLGCVERYLEFPIGVWTKVPWSMHPFYIGRKAQGIVDW